MNPHLHRVVGIDLGTTYSAVAAYHSAHAEAQLLSDSTVDGRGAATPSVVWDEPGVARVAVGRAAKQAVAHDPANTLIEIKREMGASSTAESLARFGLPDGGTEPGGPVRVWFRGRWRLPQAISALVLMKMKDIAEGGIGGSVHDAVITVPAYFTERQKKATEEAALLAGLYPRQLIPEPTAAAICYGFDRADAGRHVYLVYDLGGGTFDVSIIVVEQETIEVLATSGDRRLGGGNFDDAITDWVLGRLGVAPGTDRAWEQKVKAAAEIAKRELAVHDRTQVLVPARTGYAQPTPLPLDRATFELLITDLLHGSLNRVEDALALAKDKGVEPADVDAILLVGGSTRIPLVSRMLLEHFGKGVEFVRSDADPDTLVARGAAIVANRFASSDRFELDRRPDAGQLNAEQDDEVDIIYITEHTLGVGIQDNLVDPLIPRGQNIPRRAMKIYTNPDDATEVRCPIYQGEGRYAYENDLVGTVLLDTIESRPKGYHEFQVTFSLDINGLLDVQVRHVQADKEYRATFEQSTRIGRADRLTELRTDLLALYAPAAGVTMPGPLPEPLLDD